MRYEIGVLLAIMLVAMPVDAVEEDEARRALDDDSAAWIRAVSIYADTALRQAADGSGRNSGLLADGYELRTGMPVTWTYRKHTVVMSNAASQGNFLRMLVSLSLLTEDDRWATTARRIGEAQLDELQEPGGLLRWGGHSLFDLREDKPFHVTQTVHELKGHYPYLDALWLADPDRAARFTLGHWHAHADFSSLIINRHGAYGRRPPSPFPDPGQDKDYGVTTTTELSFAPAACDLLYSAAAYYERHPDARVAEWCRRLALRYMNDRHPDTGLGGYIYTRRPPGKDRVAAQFGPELGPEATEATLLDVGRGFSRYGEMPLTLMHVAERCPPVQKLFIQWVREDLLAYAKHSYDPATNRCRALLTNGRVLTSEDWIREGRYTKSSLKPREPAASVVWAYARAWRHTGDPQLLDTLGAMFRGGGLADLTQTDGERVELSELDADSPVPPLSLMAVVEVCRVNRTPKNLRVLRHLTTRLFKQTHHQNVFIPSTDHRFVRLNDPTALVLLHAAAVLRSPDPLPLPAPSPAMGTFYAEHDRVDAWVESKSYTDARVSDDQLYYRRTINDASD